MIFYCSESELWSNCFFSPTSNLLVRTLPALGKEIVGTGFCRVYMPQSLETIVSTGLKIVSCLFKKARSA